MADDCDLASGHEEQLREIAVDEVRRNHAALTDPANGRRRCEECGEIIPQRRREALPGVRTCIECQGEMERRG